MAYPYASPNPNNYFVGKGIVKVVTGVSVVDGWKAATDYAANTYCMLSTGTVYKTTAGGKSGATEPTSTGTDSGVTWTAVTLTDIGNVTDFKFQPEAKTLEHFSSRFGVQTLDLTVDLQRRAKFSLTMDEFTMENLSFALLGNVTGTSGSRTMSIFNRARDYTIFDFTGTNDVGQHFHVVFPAARILPPKEVGLISDKFGELSIEADVYALTSTGSFGAIQEIA